MCENCNCSATSSAANTVKRPDPERDYEYVRVDGTVHRHSYVLHEAAHHPHLHPHDEVDKAK